MDRISAMNAQPAFQVRRMNATETFLIRDWAAAEGWNPGLYDAECFFGTDPEGFFVGEVGRTPVAMISCAAYDSSFGFVGLYMVKPEFRGRGYGMRTWQAGMDYLGKERTIGLDGVAAQQKNYETSGFRFSHHHVRMEYGAKDRLESSRSPGLISLSDVAFDDVCAYDAACSPAPRPRFLRGWLRLRDSIGLAFIRDGKLGGFGVSRPCIEGFKIGPLLADDASIAEALVRGLLIESPRKPVFLDVPDHADSGARDLASRLGMREGFRTARMYTRSVPFDARVFGIASMELG